MAPLSTLWFPTRIGGAGAAPPLDPDTIAVIVKVPEAVLIRQEPPAARSTRETAAAQGWRKFYDRLLADPETTFAKIDRKAPLSA